MVWPSQVRREDAALVLRINNTENSTWRDAQYRDTLQGSLKYHMKIDVYKHGCRHQKHSKDMTLGGNTNVLTTCIEFYTGISSHAVILESCRFNLSMSNLSGAHSTTGSRDPCNHDPGLKDHQPGHFRVASRSSIFLHERPQKHRLLSLR
jgi:hypothetical protein